MRGAILLSVVAFAACLTASSGEPGLQPLAKPLLAPPALPAITTQTQTQTSRIVCYLGRTRTVRTNIGQIDISQLDQTLCTHVIVSSITIDVNGQVRLLDIREDQTTTLLTTLRTLRQRNIKTLWSLGGLTENIETINSLIRTTETRRTVVRGLVDWIRTNNWDGLDLDLAWRNNQPIDVNSLIALLGDLRLALNQNNLLLTMAASANLDVIRNMYNIPQMINLLDLINLRAIDLTLPAQRCNLLSPLYSPLTSDIALNSVDAAVQLYLRLGIPANRLILGVPMIGRQYTLADPLLNLPGSPVIGQPSILPYNRICPLLRDNWDLRWAEQQRVEYATKGNQWITYSSIRSVADRATYAQRLGLGGIAAWGIGLDDHSGVCGPRWPLLRSISAVLLRRTDPILTWGSIQALNPNLPVSLPLPNQINQPLPLPLPNLKPLGITGCNKLGFAPDLKNPNRYFRCIITGKSVRIVQMICPPTLVWNPLLNVCDWPQKRLL